jgi:predicted component of type VI protein secretion system
MSNLKGKSELKVEEIRRDAEVAMQKEASSKEALTQLRNSVKAHVQEKLGTCNNHAKGIINRSPEIILNSFLQLDAEGILMFFGQKAIDVDFCNTRLAASRDTKKQARNNDKAVKEELSKLLNSAKVALIDCLIEKNARLPEVAKNVLDLTVQYIEKFPSDIDGKTFKFNTEPFRTGDYVLNFQAQVAYKPPKQ